VSILADIAFVKQWHAVLGTDQPQLHQHGINLQERVFNKVN